MQLADFDYHLPDELIAQAPLPERAASRLLVVDRRRASFTHARFADLAAFLQKGDLLVRNETRVIPARLLGRKPTGGRVEALLVKQIATSAPVWQCLTQSSKPLQTGQRIVFPGGVTGIVEGASEDGQRLIRFECAGDFMPYLLEHGHVPLPPYIRRGDLALDHERYQTIFARTPGAVAAPTAGLHFTSGTFKTLEEQGVEVCGITLHVGPGTFLPVRTDNLLDHRMHAEAFEIPGETAERVNRARQDGRRVIALGTTVARTLEHAAQGEGRLQGLCGETDLFIRPGHTFKAVDALLTNFHLPKSTLLVLVAAFAGRDLILRAYREAVAARYRFFSYGDCMLII